MIIPDVNLLLYAHFENSVHHPRAKAWWLAALEGAENIGLPWSVIHAFIRLATNPKIMHPAIHPSLALSAVGQWLEHASVVPLVPGPRHWEILQRMVVEGQCRGAMTTDADLAALSIEHGGLFCTSDRDFSRFPGLRWTNPLLAPAA